ncbi:MAG: helix-turn-helix domain-containing protein [Betaproteobacteria bacterium]
MVLVDLVSSINRALPRLVASAARRSIDDDVLGPGIGYAFLRRGESGTNEPLELGDAGAWSSLRSTTVSILGAGTTGASVARVARRRFGAEVVCYDSSSSTESGPDIGTGCDALAEVLAAQVICVALPWTAALTAQVRFNQSAQVNARTLLVAWRRSPAFERAIVYLGNRYVEPIQLCNLATVACVSKFHLVRLFTAILGITPHRYQLLLRMAQAKAMLREGTGITNIAHGLGFADHSHLDRSFRVLMGMTPTQYQQSIER